MTVRNYWLQAGSEATLTFCYSQYYIRQQSNKYKFLIAAKTSLICQLRVTNPDVSVRWTSKRLSIAYKENQSSTKPFALWQISCPVHSCVRSFCFIFLPPSYRTYLNVYLFISGYTRICWSVCLSISYCIIAIFSLPHLKLCTNYY